MIKYAEFCAGIGGFRLGIESSMYQAKCVYRNEIDKKCEQTYFQNFNELFDTKDIFDVDSASLPDFDILCSGFPCQPFSIAGSQRGFEDDRGKIFLKLSEIIRIKLPKVVFLENVPNLVSHDKGKTLHTIVSHLQKNGYVVNKTILNSANFGIPQSRPRLYIVAFSKYGVNNVTFKFPTGSGNKKTVREILNPKDYSIPISLKWNEYIDFYLGKKTETELSFELPKTRKSLEKISSDCNLEDCIFQIRSSGIRAYSLDGQFPTFAVSNSGGGAMIPVLSKERRHISVLEIKRLMGFPDGYCFNGSRTDSIKQLANAVCPPVIKAIFEEIITTTTLGMT